MFVLLVFMNLWKDLWVIEVIWEDLFFLEFFGFENVIVFCFYGKYISICSSNLDFSDLVIYSVYMVFICLLYRNMYSNFSKVILM